MRRSLGRLVEQGIVRATEVGRNRVHELNRDHLAAPVAELLAGLRVELWRRFREVLSKWKVRPVYACAFGSAARADGDAGSDIDVLLVHPPFPGEHRSGPSSNIKRRPGAVALELAMPITDDRRRETRRQRQVERVCTTSLAAGRATRCRSSTCRRSSGPTNASSPMPSVARSSAMPSSSSPRARWPRWRADPQRRRDEHTNRGVRTAGGPAAPARRGPRASTRRREVDRRTDRSCSARARALTDSATALPGARPRRTRGPSGSSSAGRR